MTAPEDRSGGRRRRGRARPVLIGCGVVLTLGGVTAAAVGIGGHRAPASAPSVLPPATAAVERTTLVETQTVSGQLGYGDALDLTGKATGTLTWLPAPGATIARGAAAYRVDDQPVVLLYGTLPMYRPLARDVKGADVTQLTTNLKALGYRVRVTDTYDVWVAAAVKKWQKDLGVAQTGTVEPAAVVITARTVRVAELKAQLGATAGGEVYTYTGTTRTVTVALDVRFQQMVRKGGSVVVMLPDGKEVRASVTRISAVATTGDSKGDQPTTSTVAVALAIADQKRLGSYDKAPVRVRLIARQRKDVLAVPVEALLARPDGTYGVQVVTGAATRVVAVEVGLFAEGKVEISGTGIDVGTIVGVPS